MANRGSKKNFSIASLGLPLSEDILRTTPRDANAAKSGGIHDAAWWTRRWRVHPSICGLDFSAYRWSSLLPLDRRLSMGDQCGICLTERLGAEESRVCRQGTGMRSRQKCVLLL